ncbi:MAG: hypothetical protein DI637_01485 [Citromicrobium sp.]|nr:MAG: hypothetical protein DI637_01485 [Citromicrobium sp.]
MSAILSWITEGTLFDGVRNWVRLTAVATIAAIVFTVIQIADNRDGRMIETARTSGAAKAVIPGQTTTLDQLGDAHDAEQDLRAGGEHSDARFAECLENSRR